MSIEDIRFRLSSGHFELSRHAFKRVIERNITEEEICQAGTSAEVIEAYPDDKYSPSWLVFGLTRNHRSLHIQLWYSRAETVKIVAIYQPTPEEWIDLRKRRRP